MSRKVVALIPARGGSEGIPRKNLAKVGGITLVERAIRSADGCPHVSSVFVSSDEQTILDLAQLSGANSIRRPAEFSSGTARAEAVVQHFLEEAPGQDLAESDIIIYLQPTSPFRSNYHVTASLEAMFAAQTDSLVSVKETSEHPAKVVVAGDDGLVQPAPYGGDSTANRQELPRLHYPNGAIYAFTIASFLREGKIPIFGALAFIMSSHDSLDIDNHDDLLLAQAVAHYDNL